MALRNRVFRRLNRPGGRILLATAATVYKSLRYRRPCLVFYQGGLWVHRHPDGVLVEPQIILSSVSHLDRQAVDYFLFDYIPKSGDVIVDVGAGSGAETLAFSRRVASTGRVVAIEAHPLMFRCLESVCRLNQFPNVIPVHAAVAARTGEVLITDSPTYLVNTILAEGGIPVPGRTLNSIVDSLRIERIALLKMNIEGAERAALDGMAHTIGITRLVAIACHDFLADWGQVALLRARSVVENFLRQHGFEITRRSDSREWIRDTVYGRRQSSPASGSNVAT